MCVSQLLVVAEVNYAVHNPLGAAPGGEPNGPKYSCRCAVRYDRSVPSTLGTLLVLPVPAVLTHARTGLSQRVTSPHHMLSFLRQKKWESLISKISRCHLPSVWCHHHQTSTTSCAAPGSSRYASPVATPTMRLPVRTDDILSLKVLRPVGSSSSTRASSHRVRALRLMCTSVMTFAERFDTKLTSAKHFFDPRKSRKSFGELLLSKSGL